MPRAILIRVDGSIHTIDVPTPVHHLTWSRLINAGETANSYIGYLFGDDSRNRFCHLYMDVCNDRVDTSDKHQVNQLLSTENNPRYGDVILYIQNRDEDIIGLPDMDSSTVSYFLQVYTQNKVEKCRPFIEALGFIFEDTEIIDPRNFSLF